MDCALKGVFQYSLFSMGLNSALNGHGLLRSLNFGGQAKRNYAHWGDFVRFRTDYRMKFE